MLRNRTEILDLFSASIAGLRHCETAIAARAPVEAALAEASRALRLDTAAAEAAGILAEDKAAALHEEAAELFALSARTVFTERPLHAVRSASASIKAAIGLSGRRSDMPPGPALKRGRLTDPPADPL